MKVAYISLTLAGSVTLVRQGKKLTSTEVKLRIEDAKQNPPKSITQKVFSHLQTDRDGNSSIKDVDVNLVQSKCVQTLPVYKSTYDAIMSGEIRPSFQTLKEANLLIKSQGKMMFNNNAWKRLSEYQRLWLYYTDIAADMQAISFTIQLL